ncbi:TIGR02450 family Trp-rich protein [Glaciimonas sp. GG7]
MPMLTKRQIHPKKLLHSKWTAVLPANKEKHFLVTEVIPPEPGSTEIDVIEMEAVHSGRRFALRWRELADDRQWLQGWQ